MAIDGSTSYPTEDAASDIYVDLARAYVHPGIPSGEFHIFDQDRAAALTAWVSVLIPGTKAGAAAGGHETWPSAADVGAVEYMDRTLVLAPRLRPLVLNLLVRAESIAHAEHGQGFVSLPSTDRYTIMATCENAEAAAFALIKALTYEAYYRDPAVLRVVERLTGFRPRLSIDGFAVPQYDDEVMTLLAEIAARPSLVREVNAG